MDLARSAAAPLIGQADGPDAEAQIAVMTGCAEAAGADLIVATTDPAEGDALLMARRLAGFATMEKRPCVIEDIGVPPHRLVDLLRQIQRVVQTRHPHRHGGPRRDGNLYLTLMLPDLSEEIRPRWTAADEICRGAVALGGTITGKHRVGALKKRWLAVQLEPLATEVSPAVKAALDPAGILNPSRGF